MQTESDGITEREKVLTQSQRSRRRRDKCKREGKCPRCGMENDRLPKGHCSVCASVIKEYSKEGEKNRVSIKGRLALLEEEVTGLKVAVDSLYKMLK